MAKAELGSGTPLELRLDPTNTVTDSELAEYIFRETGISPSWYHCVLEKTNPSISQQKTPDQTLQP